MYIILLLALLGLLSRKRVPILSAYLRTFAPKNFLIFSTPQLTAFIVPLQDLALPVLSLSNCAKCCGFKALLINCCCCISWATTCLSLLTCRAALSQLQFVFLAIIKLNRIKFSPFALWFSFLQFYVFLLKIVVLLFSFLLYYDLFLFCIYFKISTAQHTTAVLTHAHMCACVCACVELWVQTASWRR